MLNPVQPLEYETGLFTAALSSTGLDSNLIYRLKEADWLKNNRTRLREHQWDTTAMLCVTKYVFEFLERTISKQLPNLSG